jgi:hypothetical protein
LRERRVEFRLKYRHLLRGNQVFSVFKLTLHQRGGLLQVGSVKLPRVAF